MTTFGVDFSEHVEENHTPIPHVISKCAHRIDQVGIDMKVSTKHLSYISLVFLNGFFRSLYKFFMKFNDLHFMKYLFYS